MTEFVNIISNVGFPIAAFCLMAYQLHETTKTHKEESDKWTEVLTANTLAIQKLSDLLEGMRND